MRLTRLLVEVVRDRSRIRTRYRSRVRYIRSCDIYEFVFDYDVFDYEIEKKRDRSRNRLLHRNWIRKQFVAVCVC